MSGGDPPLTSGGGGASTARPCVLVTAFEPFHGNAENASLAALRVLRDRGQDRSAWPVPIDLRTAELPVDTLAIAGALSAALAQHDPAVVVLLGESAKAQRVTLERVALNLRDFRIADNGGHRPVDQPVEVGGPAALWSTLPVKACVARVEAAGGEAELSLSAGAYLCNQALYVALRWASGRPGGSALARRVGFVHLPSLPSQVARGERRGASLSARRSAAAVAAVVSAAVDPAVDNTATY